MTTRSIVVAALALVFASPAFAQVEKKDMAGVRNYSRVDATVGCGGATDPAAMKALSAEGYVSVINLRLPTEQGANVGEERAAAQAAGMKYIHLPFNGAMPDPAVVDTFLATVADPENQPAFIHCGSAGRVSAMWMIKRALQDDWSIERAAAEADLIGPPSAALKAFATEYITSHR